MRTLDLEGARGVGLGCAVRDGRPACEGGDGARVHGYNAKRGLGGRARAIRGVRVLRAHSKDGDAHPEEVFTVEFARLVVGGGAQSGGVCAEFAPDWSV